MNTPMFPVVLGKDRFTHTKGFMGRGHRFAAACDKGFGYPKPTNEDRIFLAEDLVGVADGMGAHDDADEAAHSIANVLAHARAEIHEMMTCLRIASTSLLAKQIRAKACLTAVDLAGKKIYQAGDTQAVIIHPQSRFSRLLGCKPRTFTSPPHRGSDGIYNYLSATRCEPEIMDVSLGAGDRVLVFSDGVGRNMPADELIQASRGKTVDELVEVVWAHTQQIMEGKGTKKGKRDNRALAAVDIV